MATLWKVALVFVVIAAASVNGRADCVGFTGGQQVMCSAVGCELVVPRGHVARVRQDSGETAVHVIRALAGQDADLATPDAPLGMGRAVLTLDNAENGQGFEVVNAAGAPSTPELRVWGRGFPSLPMGEKCGRDPRLQITVRNVRLADRADVWVVHGSALPDFSAVTPDLERASEGRLTDSIIITDVNSVLPVETGDWVRVAVRLVAVDGTVSEVVTSSWVQVGGPIASCAGSSTGWMGWLLGLGLWWRRSHGFKQAHQIHV